MLTQDQIVCCIGGITLDQTFRVGEPAILGTSNPARSHQSCGGVARNVAENLARLSVCCKLIGIVGDDQAGKAVLQETAGQGVDMSLVTTVKESTTGQYTAVIQADGELLIGVADMNICDHIDRQLIDSNWVHIAAAALVFADTNMPADALEYLIERCRDYDKRLFVDAVSVPKAVKLRIKLNGVDTLFCNLDEARGILGDCAATDDVHATVNKLAARGSTNTVVTAGAAGLWYAGDHGCEFLPATPADVVDVSGAGDALIAGTLFGRLCGNDVLTSCKMGLNAASMTVVTVGRHCPDLSADTILEGMGFA
jgi:pseudouridine kinase